MKKLEQAGKAKGIPVRHLVFRIEDGARDENLESLAYIWYLKP